MDSGRQAFHTARHRVPTNRLKTSSLLPSESPAQYNSECLKCKQIFYLFASVLDFWLTAEGGRGVAGADALLAHAIVRELDMPFMIKQDVVQLQVAIDDSWNGFEFQIKCAIASEPLCKSRNFNALFWGLVKNLWKPPSILFTRGKIPAENWKKK